MRYPKAVPFIGLLMFFFMLAAQSAKAEDIIFNDLGDTIVVTGPATIVSGTCQSPGGTNSDICKIILTPPTDSSGNPGVIRSASTALLSTFYMAEDTNPGAVSDILISSIGVGTSGAAFEFDSDLPSTEGVVVVPCPSVLVSVGGCNVIENGLQQTAGTIVWEDAVTHALLRTDQIILQSDLSAVPEPANLMLFGSGLVIAGGFLRRRHRQAMTPSV